MRQKLQDLLLIIMIIGDNLFLVSLLIIASILETYLSTKIRKAELKKNFTISKFRILVMQMHTKKFLKKSM